MKHISFSFLLFLFVGMMCTPYEASAQKITGKYWLFAGYSSLESDESGYASKVGDMFQGAKLFFDADGDLDISFQGGKTYTFGYEWKADTKVLMLNFTGKDTNDSYIKFLKYYSLLCSADSEYLMLDFLEPSKSGVIDAKAKPKFSLSFRKK
jgi:hypothetical protein